MVFYIGRGEKSKIFIIQITKQVSSFYIPVTEFVKYDTEVLSEG